MESWLRMIYGEILVGLDCRVRLELGSTFSEPGLVIL